MASLLMARQSMARRSMDYNLRPDSVTMNGRPSRPTPGPVSLLVLGAGWTGTFLLPLLREATISYAATTRDGRDGTIPFTYDANGDHDDQSLTLFRTLPSAATILVTFPLKGQRQAWDFVRLYRKVHGSSNNWIQLGSTGIWKGSEWMDSNSPYDTENERAIAEDTFIGFGGCVLNLAGLYGGERQPKNWVTRVATSKAQVKAKGVLHLVHGHDVARAIIATHQAFQDPDLKDRIVARRYMLTDLHVYDWWDLIQMWGKDAREKARDTGIGEDIAPSELEYEKWVGELMIEEGVRALPRDMEKLGRRLDGRGFWHAMGIWPEVGRVR